MELGLGGSYNVKCGVLQEIVEVQVDKEWNKRCMSTRSPANTTTFAALPRSKTVACATQRPCLKRGGGWMLPALTARSFSAMT